MESIEVILHIISDDAKKMKGMRGKFKETPGSPRKTPKSRSSRNDNRFIVPYSSPRCKSRGGKGKGLGGLSKEEKLRARLRKFCILYFLFSRFTFHSLFSIFCFCLEN